MNKNSILRLSKSEKAFTLIELLVVVAIIGILSGVVIASLNSAREKGKIASIKSTLKQLYNQASLNQLEKGSFIYSNTSNTDLTCTGLLPDGSPRTSTTGNLAKIAQPLINQGIYVKCLSYSDDYLDIYQRFGATALLYDTTELKAWSVDENGVVKWDLKGVDSLGVTLSGVDQSMDWSTAKNACAKNGGRLPSIEQLVSRSYAWYQASFNSTGTGSYVPNPTSGAFQSSSSYWSSNVDPVNPLNNVYISTFNGGFYGYRTWMSYFVRCVR